VDDGTAQRLTEHYPRVRQRVTALAPLGDGAKFRPQCPWLSAGGHEKSSLGAFLPHHKGDCMSKLHISATEFDAMPNAELMNRLSFHNHCGCSPFVDSVWHYCLPLRDQDSLELFPLRKAHHGAFDGMIASHPFLRRLRESGVVATLEAARDGLPLPWRNRLDELLAPDSRWPVAYRGCMLCRDIVDRVPLPRLDEALG
jgi:hypothetical protein